MKKISSFAVIGGDKRQTEMARLIEKDGYNAVFFGFDKLYLPNSAVDIEEAEKCEAVVLPLPATKDGRTVNAPFSSKDIYMDSEFERIISGKPVFCGIAEKLPGNIKKAAKIYDYFKREDFTVLNAVPTAEGALGIAIKEYSGTVNGSRCLVAGFGRIGKILAKMLNALGANVTVSARKKEDLAWIKLLGYNPLDNSDLTSGGEYDIVFNTVPHIVLDARFLAHSAKNAVVIDLASAPGGTDFASAERLGIKTVHALALPGKTAPKTAGEIIKNTIYNIIEEEDN